MKRSSKKRSKRGGLDKRYNHSHRTKDSGGGAHAFKFPTQTKFYKPKEGRNKICIIPYEVKSKNHPLVRSGNYEIGELDYVMDVWVHQRVGVGEGDVICLKKNFSKKCPLCEISEGFKEKGKKEEYEKLKAKRRVYYNILNWRKDEPEIEVFSVSHYLFEKELIEEARASVEGDETLDFADIEEGSIISFRGSMEKYGKNEYLGFKSFKFEEREEELDEGLIEEAISFDEIMVVLSYEEMEKIYYGEEGSDEKEEDDEDDEDEEKDSPKKTRSVKRKKKEPEDEEDEDEDEEEKKKTTKKTSREDSSKKSSSKEPVSKSGKCPHGLKFGKDWDKHDKCDDCDNWDDCGDAQEE